MSENGRLVSVALYTELEELVEAVVEVTITCSGEAERWTAKAGTGQTCESDDMADAVFGLKDIVDSHL